MQSDLILCIFIYTLRCSYSDKEWQSVDIFLFSQKIRIDISCKYLHELSKPYFLFKKKKKKKKIKKYFKSMPAEYFNHDVKH